MKITKTNIKKILEKEYGWDEINNRTDVYWFADELIKDVISIIDKKLRYHKNISIRK